MKLFLKKIFQVWWLQVTYMLVSAGFISILYVYFVKDHLNFGYIIFAEALGTIASVLFILLKRQFSLRSDIQFGFILVLFGLLSLLIPVAPIFILIPYTILKVTGAIMFFIPYNILFFAKTDGDKKLYRMTTYWAIGLVIGIFAPILGGFLLSYFSLRIFVAVAIGLLFVGIFLGLFIKKKVYVYDIPTLFRHLKGFRTITLIDGALPTASQLLITLYLLTFIQNEFNFGALLSVIALLSVSFTFPLAKFSDRYKKRLELIWPLSYLAGAVMVLFYFTTTLGWAIACIILFKFVTTLLWPIQSNIICDRKHVTPMLWISRDLFLNIGRSLVLLSLVPFAYFGFLKEAFLVVGILFFALPVVVAGKKIYKRD